MASWSSNTLTELNESHIELENVPFPSGSMLPLRYVKVTRIMAPFMAAPFDARSLTVSVFRARASSFDRVASADEVLAVKRDAATRRARKEFGSGIITNEGPWNTY
jgi:hypothetical protein